jgi:peptide deformylase
VSVRPIHLLGSPLLREPAKPVDRVDESTLALVQDLFDTMRADKGIGLAANQIGHLRRVAVVDTGDSRRIVLINPVIVASEGSAVAEEGCLSIPDIFADVERATRVVVETTTADGSRERHELTELAARAVQHEIDHLDGILFLDHLSPLKRRLLLRKWEKLRKGKSGHLKEVPAATEA